MKFFADVRRLWNRLTKADRPRGRTGGGRRTPSGVYVDDQVALANATFYAGTHYLAKTVAQLPYRAHRELREGGSEPATNHPVDWLIYKRPNPEMGSFTFRQTLMVWAITLGNGYAEIERDNRGLAYALWPIHPNRVEVRRDDYGTLFYRVNNQSGGYADIPAMDMLHIRGYGDGPVGVSVIEYAAQSIGWARATELFGQTFFGEGMNPTSVIEYQKSLSPEAKEILEGEIEALYKGPKGKRHLVIDDGMKFTKLSQTPDDAQFIETRQHQVEEICRWLGVPPHKVMHLLRSTFSNIEHQSIEVVVDSIVPWCKIWEDECDYKLFGPNNRAGFFTKLNLNGLLRADTAARSAFYQTLFGTGALSPNDILRLEDRNPIGPQGDVRFVSNNVQTLERAIAGPPTQPAPAPAAPTPNPKPPQEDNP